MSTIDNLNLIYTSKNSIKTALGTESDDFTYYGSYVTSAITTSYNNGYSAGYDEGQSSAPSGLKDYSQEYFTIESLEDGNVITLNVGVNTYYSYDKTSWTLFNTTTSFNLDTNDKIYFYAASSTFNYNSGVVQSTKMINASGNIMSLVFGTDFVGQTSLAEKGGNTFLKLFYNNIYLIDASNLILPATTLAGSCYQNMFQGCASLIATPILPATTLANYCYSNMFRGCTSLTVVPKLPATTLAEGCYQSMFNSCTSLKYPSELPATTLAKSCYANMFQGCTKLRSAPDLLAPILVNNCYDSMFQGCSDLVYIKCLATDISASSSLTYWVQTVGSVGVFYKNYSTSWPSGQSGIPSGWTTKSA